jgi:2-polyprenyl-3-methyl-5-hydroxy-6-metoxy-1,4-benzoquinol methylase
MKKYGRAEFKNGNIYGYGNVRLGPTYYQFLLKDISKNKKILDIGCGDGVIGNIVGENVNYKGVDIGAGCYNEVESGNIEYIRDYDELLISIKNSNPDISILINVLEHTFDFSGLFEKTLECTKGKVLVSLPNEENIHVRLRFLFGKGINSHGLEFHGRHVNSRHLWFIQILKAEEILKKVAKSYGYEMTKKVHYLAFPATRWKRVFYRLGMFLLPWSLKARNFTLLFEKK